MLTSFTSKTRTLQLLAAILIALLLIVPGPLVRPSSAQVSDNTYISPQFGFSMSWDDTWFEAGQESAEYDLVTVTNGLTYCTLVGGPDTAPTPEVALAEVMVGLRSSTEISQFAPLLDENGDAIRGGDEQHAFAAFTYTLTLDDGTEAAMATYVDTRLITPGQTMLAFVAAMLASNFESERPHFEPLLDSVRVGPQPNPIANGEPAPVFISGAWRIAVATASVRPTFADLGLKKKSGKEWLVAVVDVTNWSNQDAVLSARKFTIQTGNGQKPAKIALSSMPRVADALGTTPFADDLTLEIAAGQTVRVTLAFVIPAEADTPALAIGSEALPLADITRANLQSDGLPALAAPPELIEGKITSAADGQTLWILLGRNKQRASRIRLLGVNLPADGTCFANNSRKALDDLAGESVLIEEDAAITGGSVPSRYIWLINDDGTRTLLNQRLIAEGNAYAALLPADARFAAWFDATARTADLADIGLWSGCASTESDASIGIAATPVAVPANREDATK